MSGVQDAGRRVRATLAEGFRDVIWSDIREGLPRLSDLPPTVRVLGTLGTVLILVAATGLFFVEAMRSSSSLVLGGGTLTGRPQLVPLVLLPLAIAGLAVAWTYLLAGAAQSHALIRVTVAVLYAATTLMWFDGTAITSHGAQRAALVAVAAAAVVVVLLPRRVLQEHAATRFALLGLLTGVAWIGAAVLGAQTSTATAVATPVVTLGLLLSLARGLALPLFVVAGLGMAVFAYQLSTWAAGTARAGTGSRAQRLLLVALLAVAAVMGARTAASTVRDGDGAVLLGALIFVGLPVAVWLGARRWSARPDVADEDGLVAAAEGSVSLVAALFLAPLGIATILMLVAGGVGAGVHLTGGTALLSDIGQSMDGLVQRLTASADVYRLAFILVAGLGGALLVRRRPTLGVYLLVLAAANGWVAAVSTQALAGLDWLDSSRVALWLTLLVLVRFAVLLRRGDLDAGATRDLTVATAIVVLFSQVDFLENPFNPVFAFAGVAFVAAAVAVDTLTLGNWANTGTPSLPRTSRLFLYVGYALFSLVLVMWAAATHDFAQFDLYTGDAAVGGLRLFGDPLLLALVAALAFGDRRARDGADAPVRPRAGAG